MNAVNAWRQIPLHCAIESRHDDEGVNVEYLVSRKLFTSWKDFQHGYTVE